MSFIRFLLGLAALPATWAFTRVLIRTSLAAVGLEKGFSVEFVSLLAGIGAFSLCWVTIPHPVRTYVLGHELTHALWSLAFGGKCSSLRISAEGGSVNVTKSNIFVTLAPYFFPFYTFIVIIAALITYAFLRPLPFMPLWMFLIGFTWAFHILFTIESLTVQQPDVKVYGRLFSWTFIYIANLSLVLVWLTATSEFTFAALWGLVRSEVIAAYIWIWHAALCGWGALRSLWR